MSTINVRPRCTPAGGVSGYEVSCGTSAKICPNLKGALATMAATVSLLFAKSSTKSVDVKVYDKKGLQQHARYKRDVAAPETVYERKAEVKAEKVSAKAPEKVSAKAPAKAAKAGTSREAQLQAAGYSAGDARRVAKAEAEAKAASGSKAKASSRPVRAAAAAPAAEAKAGGQNKGLAKYQKFMASQKKAGLTHDQARAAWAAKQGGAAAAPAPRRAATAPAKPAKAAKAAKVPAATAETKKKAPKAEATKAEAPKAKRPMTDYMKWAIPWIEKNLHKYEDRKAAMRAAGEIWRSKKK